MNEYIANIFENGRIALIEEKDYSDALEQKKEILVFCGGWSGGYTRAFGADLEHDLYNGADCFSCYAYDVNEKTFTPEQIAKFHRVVVTDGVQVFMKTGNPATNYSGGFHDYATTFEEYKGSMRGNKNATIEEFYKLRNKIDTEMTLNMIRGDKKEEIRNAIKGYLR